MLIWTIAALLFISFGIVGYYQGALRGTVTFIGLVAAILLAIPLGGVFGWIVNLFGLEHPVLLAFIGPFAAYVAVLVCFKAGGMAVHKQVDTYFKYKASDTVRLLYDRMNARVGIAVGLVNAFVYVVLVGVAVYLLGYFAIQVRTTDRDSFAVKSLARLAQDLRETKLDQAVAAFIPKAELYFDGCDVLAMIFQNHLLQNRLATYPPFLPLSERSDFKQMATRTEFQDFWIKGPSAQEFRSHELIKPLVESKEQYENLVALQGGDFKDLKEYLETGKSKKYDGELILGRWEFDGAASFALARKRKPNMTLQQQRLLRGILGRTFKDAVIVAMVDKKITFKMPNAGNAAVSRTGQWEPGKLAGYELTFPQEGGGDMKLDALVEGRRMTFVRENIALVFDKE